MVRTNKLKVFASGETGRNLLDWSTVPALHLKDELLTSLENIKLGSWDSLGTNTFVYLSGASAMKKVLKNYPRDILLRYLYKQGKYVKK